MTPAGTCAANYFFPNSLNLIILTSVECLSSVLVTRTIIKMHNIFRLVNTHSECQTWATSPAAGPSASIRKLAWLSLLWPSWRGRWTQRPELQHTAHPDMGVLCQAILVITTLFCWRWPRYCGQQKGFKLAWTCQSRREFFLKCFFY